MKTFSSFLLALLATSVVSVPVAVPNGDILTARADNDVDEISTRSQWFYSKDKRDNADANDVDEISTRSQWFYSKDKRTEAGTEGTDVDAISTRSEWFYGKE